MYRRAKRITAAILAAVTALTPVLGHIPVMAEGGAGGEPDAAVEAASTQEEPAGSAQGTIRVGIVGAGTVTVTLDGESVALTSDEDGNVKEQKGGGAQEAAMVDAEGTVLAFTAEEGKAVHVDVSPAGGYDVARYSVMTDSGTDEASKDFTVGGTKTVRVEFAKSAQTDSEPAAEVTEAVETVDASNVSATESATGTATESETEPKNTTETDAESTKDESAATETEDSKAETGAEDGQTENPATENETTESTDDGQGNEADKKEADAEEAETVSKDKDAEEEESEDGKSEDAETADRKDSKSEDAGESKADGKKTIEKASADAEDEAEDNKDAKEDATEKDAKGIKKTDVLDEESDVVEEESGNYEVPSSVRKLLGQELLAGADDIDDSFYVTEYGTLHYGKPLPYGNDPNLPNNGTQMYTISRAAQEGETTSPYAFCVRPDLHVGGDGSTYKTYRTEPDGVWLRRVMYHSYKAPGWSTGKPLYDKYVANFQKPGASVSKEDAYYILSHVVLSYAYTRYSDSRSLNWSTEESWQTGLDAKQQQDVINLYLDINGKNGTAALSNAPSNFAVYSTRGNGYQDMLYWVLLKEIPAYAWIHKVSANPEITDNNSKYSLVNTTFKVYSARERVTDTNADTSSDGVITVGAWTYDDRDCVATLVVKEDKGGTLGGYTQKVKVNVGTYYVIETAAGKGYNRRVGVKTLKVTKDHTGAIGDRLTAPLSQFSKKFKVGYIAT